MKIHKGDTVKILAGNDKGKTGRVLRVERVAKRVFVEGIRMIKRHSRPTQRNPKGGIIEREGSIHVSNVALYKDGRTVKIGYGWRESDDKHKTKYRIDRSSGEPV